MANLISDIMATATPAIINKIALGFGLSGNAVTSLLGAAIPGVMGSLINKGSTPGGAKDILTSLVGASPNLVSTLSSGNAATLAKQGTSMLTALIGHDGLSTLNNAIAGSTGVPAASSASVMGLATQMVMGGLAKNVAGLDGAGLCNLLALQKGYVEQALPEGLSSVLGMASTANAAARNMGSAATPAASSAASTVRNTVSQASHSMPAASGGMGWLKYAIPVALIALAAWYIMGHRGNDDATMTKPTATITAAAPAAPAVAVMVGDVDVSKTLTGALGDLTASLGGVTDVATAQTALPKLQIAGASITNVLGVLDKFTPEQKAAVAGLVNNGLPAITAAALKVEGIAGAGDLLKPLIDAVVTNLSYLTK